MSPWAFRMACLCCDFLKWLVAYLQMISSILTSLFREMVKSTLLRSKSRLVVVIEIEIYFYGSGGIFVSASFYARSAESFS